VSRGELLGSVWGHKLWQLHAVPGGELLGDGGGFIVHAVCGGDLLSGCGGNELWDLHGVSYGELLGRGWGVERGYVHGVSCGDTFAGGERHSFRLHLCCGLHGGLGRCGLHGV